MTNGWLLQAGEPAASSTQVRMSDDTAWKLLFNALTEPEIKASLVIDGRADLAAPLLKARSIVLVGGQRSDFVFLHACPLS